VNRRLEEATDLAVDIFRSAGPLRPQDTPRRRCGRALISRGTRRLHIFTPDGHRVGHEAEGTTPITTWIIPSNMDTLPAASGRATSFALRAATGTASGLINGFYFGVAFYDFGFVSDWHGTATRS
jgi:hypothetical protein